MESGGDGGRVAGGRGATLRGCPHLLFSPPSVGAAAAGSLRTGLGSTLGVLRLRPTLLSLSASSSSDVLVVFGRRHPVCFGAAEARGPLMLPSAQKLRAIDQGLDTNSKLVALQNMDALDGLADDGGLGAPAGDCHRRRSHRHRLRRAHQFSSDEAGLERSGTVEDAESREESTEGLVHALRLVQSVMMWLVLSRAEAKNAAAAGAGGGTEVVDAGGPHQRRKESCLLLEGTASTKPADLRMQLVSPLQERRRLGTRRETGASRRRAGGRSRWTVFDDSKASWSRLSALRMRFEALRSMSTVRRADGHRLPLR